MQDDNAFFFAIIYESLAPREMDRNVNPLK
jgi:hypothetical protein